MKVMRMRAGFVAATAVAALLGVAACSAAPRTVSIRSAGDSTPLAADPEPTTVDPTATTVEQPTVTTAPVATTMPTATTQPTSSTTAAVTPTTTAPVTASTVQPVTATTAAVTATTAVTPVTTAALQEVPSLQVAKDSQCPEMFGYALNLSTLNSMLASQGMVAPAVVIRDRPGLPAVGAPTFNMAAAKQALLQCVSARGGGVPVLSLSVPAGAELLAQAVKTQLDSADWTGYTAYYPTQGLTLVAA